MDVERALVATVESIGSITNPRFFETERGFQGQLLMELGKRLKLPDQVVIEQEYQKRLDAHGLTSRPDIVIHEPFDPRRHADRKAGNYMVIELKLNSSEAEAKEDFKSLAGMLEVLNYPMGVFVNIGSENTYEHLVPEKAKGRIAICAVQQTAGGTRVQVVRT